MGTGSGAIALAVAGERPDVTVWATEQSEAALAWARRNALSTGLAVTLLPGDLLSPLPAELRGELDVIVSNPPYVALDERAALPRDVVEHEPHEALFAGGDGTEVIERLARDSRSWLADGGHLVVEIGAAQGEVVSKLLQALGYEEVRVKDDLSGKPRIVTARSPDDPELGAVVAALLAGGVALVPTDTVYGLAALPRYARRLFAAKKREPAKTVPVLGASAQDLARIVVFDEKAARLAARFWPGSLTMVLPRAPHFSHYLGAASESVGVRVPAERRLLRLLARTGPLAVTSANLSGHEPATTLAEARAVFGAGVSALSEGQRAAGVPSTVVSLLGAPAILRRGALSEDDLRNALR